MIDAAGRIIDYMRISITDRCNLRCRYCMPDGITQVAMSEILTYEEIKKNMHACGRAWNPEDQDYRRRAAGKKRLCGSDRNDKRDSGYHPGDDDDKRVSY